MNVTLKHLRAFVALAGRGSFTQAASDLAVSQPALTLSIHQLENELGLKLFDRTTRRVWLTAAGEEFRPTAERLLADFDGAFADLRALSERRRGRVSLATLPSVARRLLPRPLARFTEAHPGIRVQLQDANASGVQARVAGKQVDFGIASLWEQDDALACHRLLRDPFVAVFPADHPLAAAKGPLAWAELADHPCIGMGRDTGIWSVMEAAPALPQSVAEPRYEVSNIATVEGLLKAGLGVAALPALAVPDSPGPPLAQRPLVAPKLDRDICLLTLRGRSLSPAAQGLYDLLRKALPGDISFGRSGRTGQRRGTGQH